MSVEVINDFDIPSSIDGTTSTPSKLVGGTVEELLRVDVDASEKKIIIQITDTLVGENNCIMYEATAVDVVAVPHDKNKTINKDSND